MFHDFSADKLSQALDANEIASWKLFLRHFPQAQFHIEPELLWFETGIRHDVFNRVVQANLAPGTCSATIERVLAHFREQHTPFLWHVGPSSSPAKLGTLLEQAGMTHYETEPGLFVDMLKLHETLPVASQLTIHPVTTHEQLEQWLRIWERGSAEEVISLWLTLYSRSCLSQESPMRMFLGMLDGEPVGCSGVFLGTDVATIGPVGTLPQHRHLGIGAALTLAALHEARRHNYRVAVLTASPMGIAIYSRIGFQEYCTASVYLWHPSY